jgi:hypothetical protein
MPPVRILVETTVDTATYTPNQVVDFTPAIVKSLTPSGAVDATPEAVAYCVEQLGQTVIKHGAAVAAPAA